MVFLRVYIQLTRFPLPFLITPFGVLPLRDTDEIGGVSDHPPILPPGLMYTAQVAFIGFTKGLMTGIMRVM